MSLVVDASVAIKWFVTEDLHQESLGLLDLQVRLVAPELLKAEFANILWKKVRRTEVAYDAAVTLLEQIESFVTCIPTSTEVLRCAFRYSATLDHPAYDCIYLALAEQLGTKLVTADVRFANKLSSNGLGHLIMHLTERLTAPGVPTISKGDLKRLLDLSARYDATINSVYEQLRPVSPRFSFINAHDLSPAFDSPAHRRLERALSKLSDDELTDLAALAWLGRGYDGEDFSQLKRHALKTFQDGPSQHIPYITSLLRYVERGRAALMRRTDEEN